MLLVALLKAQYLYFGKLVIFCTVFKACKQLFTQCSNENMSLLFDAIKCTHYWDFWDYFNNKIKFCFKLKSQHSGSHETGNKQILVKVLNLC